MSVDVLEGDLSTTSMPDIVRQLSDDQRTGVLRVDGGGELWVKDGAVYLAITGASADVRSVLFGAGIGSLEVIGQMLEQETNVAGNLADADPQAAQVLARLLHEHNLTGMFELLVPAAGSFSFEDGPVHAVGSRFAEPAAELLAQAQQRLEIWRQIAARIPSTAVSFRLARRLPEGVGEERLVTRDEWRYLSLLDSHRSVADVINETGESAFRVCSSLYRLLLEEIIEEVPAAG